MSSAECRLTPSGGFAWSALISFAKRFIPAMAAHSALGSQGAVGDDKPACTGASAAAHERNPSAPQLAGRSTWRAVGLRAARPRSGVAAAAEA
jgi:hypothetical protein